MSEPRFVVLLGGDYAGKSTVMRALAVAEPSWRLLSVDEEFLAPEHMVISRLKAELVTDILPAMGKHHSPDFVACLLHTAVVHLRDQVLASGPHQPVVVDSYYYEILAKCRLIGATADPLFNWWRGFPQPRRVLFLDVDPATAWARSAGGARTNRLEFHGEDPDPDAFAEFQMELCSAMLDEVAHLPIELIPSTATGNTVAVARRVRGLVTREFA